MSQSADKSPVPEVEPVVGRLVSAPTVRVGSPFANAPDVSGVGDAAQRELFSMETMEAGVTRETAQGGVLAAALLIPFAALSCWWFPFGGVLVAGLGGGLGLFGLASRRPSWAVVLLSIHVLLFSVAYWRLI